MTTWADGSATAFKDLDAAPAGTGAKLPGQHDLTDAERKKYRNNQDDYSYNTANELIKATGGRMNQTPEQANSAHRIGQAYDDSLWGGKQEYLKAAQNQPLGDLNDPSARLKAMSFITQDKPLKADGTPEKNDGSTNCSGASIVGAAFLAEGPDGLKKVMQAIEKQDPSGKSTKADPEYLALKDKLAKNPDSLTVADIQTLQNNTTKLLNANQKNDKDLQKAIEPGASGIHGKTMDTFMEKSPELAKMFKENGMELQGIDNDGALNDTNKGVNMDHWVVKMKGKDGKEAIYDPLARRGGQIIDFDEGVKHYDKARFDTVGKPD